MPRHPVGELRWKAPQSAAGWSGVRHATRIGKRCGQGTGWDPGYEEPTLTEDCLYLNVYVPHSDWTGGRSANRAALVWIHGGGFTGGARRDTGPRKYLGSAGRGVRHDQLSARRSRLPEPTAAARRG